MAPGIEGRVPRIQQALAQLARVQLVGHHLAEFIGLRVEVLEQRMRQHPPQRRLQHAVAEIGIGQLRRGLGEGHWGAPPMLEVKFGPPGYRLLAE
jgi:hypothetical protein